MKYDAYRVIAAALVCAAAVAAATPADAVPKRLVAFRPHVVVATLDTGTNPFHPAWRRDQTGHPSTIIPGYPRSARSLDLTFAEDQAQSVAASKGALASLVGSREPYWIPGTNLIGTWAHPEDRQPIFDLSNPTDPGASHAHGARASSQIAGLGFGLAPDAYLVIADRTPDGGSTSVYKAHEDALRWAADQPWIDIIHTNIQDPIPATHAARPVVYNDVVETIEYALSKGKLVVAAAGNFWGEPTETSPHAGPPGVLVAGANDNCGYADYANLDPHVVMDGYLTRAAAPDDFGDTQFSGTSSSSPRVTGYAAQLLLELRRRYGYVDGIRDGALIEIPKGRAPAAGPLADGRLLASELNEVIRNTADPNPHESKWDGDTSTFCIPQPASAPFAVYPKMGYGEVSEHTIDGALQVVTGEQEMPSRPYEDLFYDYSERLREALWP